MDSWIWQPGYPLVSASIVDDTLVLRQQRFLFDASSRDPLDPQTWAVPVHIRHGDTTTTLLLDTETASLDLSASPDSAVIVNAGGHGFYRVAYSDELRERIDGTTLRTLSTLERYNLVDDAWSATVAGEMSAGQLLSFLHGFVEEDEHAVWQAITIALRGVGRVLDDGPQLDAFRSTVRDLTTPALVALGEPSDDESDLDRKLRGLLVSTAGVLGNDVEVQARCREWFEAARGDSTAVDPELISAATSVVAATGDASTYDVMRERFQTARTPQEQLRNLFALAEFDDESLVLATCEFAMSESVKTQNAPFLLRAAIANRRHGAAAWRFVRDRWDDATDRFPSNTIVRMVDSVKLLTTAESVAETASFFEQHPIEQASKTLEQILERQRINAAFRGREAGRFGGVAS